MAYPSRPDPALRGDDQNCQGKGARLSRAIGRNAKSILEKIHGMLVRRKAARAVGTVRQCERCCTVGRFCAHLPLWMLEIGPH
jgi:hypothetical protein